MSGSSACQVGRLRATPVPSTNPRARRRPGVIASVAVRIAMARAEPPMIPWARSINFARSNMSASAPAARAKKRRGREVEATINPTHVFDPVRSNISWADDRLWMKVPNADSSDATQSVRKEP
jgi:hypothetical protein